LLHCFAGCETRDVLSSIGLDFEDLFPNKIADERKIHRPFHSDDILSAAAGELMVASLILSDFKNGKQLAQEQYNRLWLAVGRVTTAAEIANGLN
jgi:membrane-anchored protein YejM (alkaline phosphatase superfamily)